MNAILIIFALACYLSFVWAATFFFKVDDEGSKSGKAKYAVLGFLAIMFSLVSVVSWHGSVLSFVIGTLLFLMSFSLFWWTISSVKKIPFQFAGSSNAPPKLVTIGPFLFVRHPFYLSYLLGWVAAAITSSFIISYVIPISMAYFYYEDAKSEETFIKSGPLGDEYEAYQYQTGMFLPTIEGWQYIRSLLFKRAS